MTSNELEDYIYDCDYIAPDSPKPDYRYVVKLVLRVTLFFRDGHTASTRSALWTCFSDYFKAFSNHLQWGWDPLPKGADPKPWHFEERLANEVHQTLTTSPPDSEIDLAFYDSFNPKYVGNYGITCMTVPDWHQAKNVDGSYLSFWVAPDSFLRGIWDQGTFPIHDFVLACCNRLNATHGYAGFSLALPDEFARWQSYELELAERYFVLEIDVPVFVALMTEGWKGIKGVNWYAVLGSRYTEELGGAKSIHSQLTDPAFRIYHLNSGGVVIRAGDGPQMAPVAKGLPPLYVAVNKIVRPARTTKVQSIGLASIGGELRFNDRLTDLWMRRFDAPGIWPPAHP